MGTKNTQQTGPVNPYRKYFGTDPKAQPMRLLVRPEAKEKMDAYVRLVDVEVGWMGFVKCYDREHEGFTVPGLLVLEDVFLYEQEVSGASVDATGFEVGKVLEQLVAEGVDTDRIAQLRFFAHSHAGMAAYHSSTDVEQIDDMAATGLDWFISHVQNKKGDIDCRFDMFTPFRLQVAVQEIELTSSYKDDAEYIDEINSKVRKRTYQTHTSYWQNGRQVTQGANGGRSQGSTSTKKDDEWDGTIHSEESLDRDKRGPSDAGTPTTPMIRHRQMAVSGEGSKMVRQEIVHGCIIHEAVSHSTAAKARDKMTDAERIAYYAEWKQNDLMEADQETTVPSEEASSTPPPTTTSAGEEGTDGGTQEEKPLPTPTAKTPAKSSGANSSGTKAETGGKPKVKPKAAGKDKELVVATSPEDDAQNLSVKQESDDPADKLEADVDDYLAQAGA